jgi:hypothetical protein
LSDRPRSLWHIDCTWLLHRESGVHFNRHERSELYSRDSPHVLQLPTISARDLQRYWPDNRYCARCNSANMSGCARYLWPRRCFSLFHGWHVHLLAHWYKRSQLLDEQYRHLPINHCYRPVILISNRYSHWMWRSGHDSVLSNSLTVCLSTFWRNRSFGQCLGYREYSSLSNRTWCVRNNGCCCMLHRFFTQPVHWRRLFRMPEQQSSVMYAMRVLST